jgi:hypothetical protein
MTPETQDGPVVDFPQGSVTFRTGETGRFSHHIVEAHVGQLLCCDGGLDSDIYRDFGRRAGWLARKATKQAPNLARWTNVVHLYMAQRATGHRTHHGLFRPLYDGNTPTALDRTQSRGSVGKSPR